MYFQYNGTKPCTLVHGRRQPLTSSSKGNKMLTYPIGLITADEIVYAGGVHAVRVSNMYLNTKSRYWTMSPSSTAWSGGTYMFYMQDDSVMLPECLYALGRTSLISGVRPVINLKPDVTISSGDGTSSNPYVIS